MRIVGVIDLLGGRAVHARAGERDKYAPVAAVAGDALALAKRYLDAGVSDLYVADLNAILSSARQDALITRLAGIGAPMWLDAGVTTELGARECLTLGASHIIAGLETLTSFDALAAICTNVGGNRVAFSLDLRNGKPVLGGAGEAGGAGGAGRDNREALACARRAVEAGVGAILVLDLARVGTGNGVDLALISSVRAVAPGIMLLAGGGVRGADDLERLSDAGCDGALVATAFHDGRIGAAEIQAKERR
jgi:phosphoribosylformimino-5-aminoimidazole carboxamide ribotide isomerase